MTQPSISQGLLFTSTVDETYTLSQLAGNIKRTLSVHLQPSKIWVQGEIRDLRYHLPKNHYYLKLVETTEQGDVLASFSATIWSNSSAIVDRFIKETGQQLTDKLSVRVLCMVSYHQQFGLSLNILDVDPFFTVGNLEAARQKVLVRLEQTVSGISRDGSVWLTPNKLLELPKAIKRIALLSASSSDGMHDFEHELQNNGISLSFLVTHFPVQVQGKGSERSLVTALETISTDPIYDIVVIARGGGSELDLLVFDSFELGKAIALCPVPVLIGVGHERNLSVADLVAKHSVKTPTKAAAFIVGYNTEAYQSIFQLQKRAADLLMNLFSSIKHHITNLQIRGQLLFANRIVNLKSQLMQLQQRAVLFSRLRINMLRSAIDVLITRAASADPRTILKRGFFQVEMEGSRIEDITAVPKNAVVKLVGYTNSRNAKLLDDEHI